MNLARDLYEQLPEPEDAPEYKRSLARRQLRVPIDIEIDGKVSREIAETRDVTPTSMGITCKMELPERARVRVSLAFEGEWSEAVVVHCATTVGAYKIGLEMVEE
jgi:hypothetical protein